MTPPRCILRFALTFEKVHILSFKQPFCEPLFSNKRGLRMDHSMSDHAEMSEIYMFYYM